MSELLDHLRKDVKLLSSNSLFVILMVMLAVIAFIMAFQAALSYLDGAWQYYYNFATRLMIENQQRIALEDYWQALSALFIVLFAVISSMIGSSERESGMIRYILTFKTGKNRFYLSKFLVLAGIAAYAITVSTLAYVIVFSALDLPFISAGDLLTALLFPLLTVLVISSIGLAVSALVTKKGAAIAGAVVLIFLISIGFSTVLSMGESAAYDARPELATDDYLYYMPLTYKLAIYSNPMVLLEGEGKYFDTVEGVVLGLAMIAAYLCLGMVIFSRERTERSLLNDLKDRYIRGIGSGKEKGT